MRIWFGLAGAWLVVQSLAGQPALLRHGVARAETCLGVAEVTGTAVEPGHGVVIAFLGDTLREDEVAWFGKEISSFYQAVNRTDPVRLALVIRNNVQFAGPFKTRASLQAALEEITAAAGADGERSPLRFYTALATVASQLGSDWSTVVLAGRFPPVAADLAPFTEGWLSMRLRAAKLRVSYWTPSGIASAVMDAVTPSTGGTHLVEGLAPLASALKRKAEFSELAWRDPSPGFGFRACPISLIGSEGEPSVAVPSVVAAQGATIPELERYELMLQKTQSVAAAMRQPELSQEVGSQAEADLSAALEIGPGQEEALRLGADLYKRRGNDLKLSAVLKSLTEMAPNEAQLFAELGHARYRLADWDGADRALLRAREMKPGDPMVAEELARIRLTRQDDRGALPLLEESLAEGGTRQELWLLRADLAMRLGDWARTADSLEHALDLGGVPLDRRTTLVRLYIDHQQPDKALVHVREVAADLPQDVAVRGEYAGFLDTLRQPEEALQAWQRVLDVDPKLERAHIRIARLLIDKNALSEALKAAEAGIQAAPQSASLYLAKAEILEKQNRYYDARRTLREAAPKVPDPELIERLAEMEDAGGQHAAKYYRQVVEAGEKGSAPVAERSNVIDRGLRTALRDGDLEEAAWFRSRQAADTLGARSARASGGTVTIPGGLAALSFAAHSRQSSPERFLVEYARTVAGYLDSPEKKAAQIYAEGIREHFRRIAELSALGTATNGKVTVTISLTDQKFEKNGEKILGLLGWKVRTSRQGVKLEIAEKGARATHETASALALNEIGMQHDLEAGKPFSFEIPTEVASVVLGEEAWRAQFYPKEKYTGGLAEAMANDLRLAQTYAAVGQMEPSTASVLALAVGLKTLAEKYAPLLVQYSSALAVEQGHVAVPGGVAAEADWASLVGASPREPAPFFRALLAKDDGRLLAYYAALSELDIQHQRFFTRTSSRTAKFYQLFKDAPETRSSNPRYIRSGSFVEFLAQVPLDSGGSVDFPGSPEVWTVAKGQSRSAENMVKMLKKLKRAVAPDVEDEILLRLANTRYKQRSHERTELDNFLAVVRVDEHRPEPLDENSALLLAQHYAEDEAAYPYFATLTGLGQQQFEQFFALSEALRDRSDDEKNAVLPAVNSLIEILCLAQEAGRFDEMQSAELFGEVVKKLGEATSPAARTATSLDLVRMILERAGKAAAADPDEAIRSVVLGSDPPSGVEVDGALVTVAPSMSRHRRYQQVLELQKVPSLATVLALSDAARNLGAGKGASAGQIQILESKAGGLIAGETPKELGLKGKQKEQVQGFQPRRLQEIVKQFRQKTANQKVNQKDLEKLSQDYLEEMDVPVRWALEGIVYAYFLSPDDLLVSEDPLLIRKHQFVRIPSPAGRTLLWQHARLVQSSENAGSNFEGGFADFGDAAGRAAAKGARLGGEYGEEVAAKQIGTLRMTNWGRLRDEDLRLVGLKVTVAREWIVRAAGQPELETALAEATLGLLSPTRRADLLAALAEDSWSYVWGLISLSDLYFLGDRYLEHYAADPWKSPATIALRQASEHNNGSRLQALGGEFDETLDCSHPHLRMAPPYEEYEKDLLTGRLAERSAEFKLYLARYADAAGIPASALEAVAEPAARAILKKLHMSDPHDWRSVLAAYQSLDDKTIQEVVER